MLAAAILRGRRRRAGAVLAALCALFLLVLLTLPIGNWALRPLEDLYSRPAWPEHIDGILVLGEGLNAEILSSRGVPGIGDHGGSLLAAAILARRYPAARLVFSGGSGELDQGLPEARVAARLFGELGLSPVIEDRARNSWENILYSRDLVRPEPGQVWLLVADAAHLPRAMAAANKLGWPLLPWPSDYLTAAQGPEVHLSLAANLAHLDKAAHEALGLLAYRLSGKGA